MSVTFTSHAKQKFYILMRHSCTITEEEVKRTVEEPDSLKEGRRGRMIAQRVVDREHLLRVIYEKRGADIVIITFYPARRVRYENQL
jgi:hypothetical protein